jgi:hypothetical protein
MNMKRLLLPTCLGLCLGLPASLRADVAAEGLSILQAGYVDFPALRLRSGETLADIAAHSDGKISLKSPDVHDATTPTILPVLLPDNIVYLRAASFQPAGGWPELAAQLEKWSAHGVPGLILDLRSNVRPDDFEGAARLAGLFTSAGTPLFTVTDALRNASVYASIAPLEGAMPPTWPMVVLVNHQTAGAAEALAASLRANGALVIGHRTMGRGALFAERPLPSGQILRYDAGVVVMADGQPLWNHPVAPDISPLIGIQSEQNALALIAEGRILDVIRESAERHRMTEAALVRDEDPEIDSLISSHAPKNPGVAVAQDVVLVDSLDSLKAIRLAQRTAASSGLPASSSIPSAVR